MIQINKGDVIEITKQLQLHHTLSLYRILYIINYIRTNASPALGCSLFLSGCKHNLNLYTN